MELCHCITGACLLPPSFSLPPTSSPAQVAASIIEGIVASTVALMIFFRLSARLAMTAKVQAPPSPHHHIRWRHFALVFLKIVCLVLKSSLPSAWLQVHAACACVMGLAVTAMHYIGMQAATYYPSSSGHVPTGVSSVILM